MWTTIILIDPFHAFSPMFYEQINQGSGLETILIIRAYIVVTCIFLIFILHSCNHQIRIQRLQYMLVRAG